MPPSNSRLKVVGLMRGNRQQPAFICSGASLFLSRSLACSLSSMHCTHTHRHTQKVSQITPKMIKKMKWRENIKIAIGVSRLVFKYHQTSTSTPSAFYIDFDHHRDRRHLAHICWIYYRAKHFYVCSAHGSPSAVQYHTKHTQQNPWDILTRTNNMS